jgi:hypothetical protein
MAKVDDGFEAAVASEVVWEWRRRRDKGKGR